MTIQDKGGVIGFIESEILRIISDSRDEMLVRNAVYDTVVELKKASDKFGRFTSAHEGFAVLLEEVDELWDHVKVNQTKRDIPAMKKEAIQIAAMAIRFAVDCANEENGRR